MWVLVQSLEKCRSLSTNAKRTLVLMYVSICLYLALAPQGSRVLSGNTRTRLCLNPFLCCHIFYYLPFEIYIFGRTLNIMIYHHRESRFFFSSKVAAELVEYLDVLNFSWVFDFVQRYVLCFVLRLFFHKI